MKRITLPEFEDLHWLPDIIRSGVTNLIVVFHRLMGTPVVIAGLISKLAENGSFKRIVDLGSGSGGPMPEVIRKINSLNPGMPFQLLLTDLHPNQKLIREINESGSDTLSYHNLPVDATNLSEAPKGLKTMIASFHHMDPAIAKDILRSAQDTKDSILIYEITKNNIPVVLWALFLPISLALLVLMSLIMTPFVRPFTFRQFLFTYIVPVIPLVYAWDGQASAMRTYTFDDIRELLDRRENDDYTWEIGEAKKGNGKNVGYYVMGFPGKPKE